jgi:hypothetical protein
MHRPPIRATTVPATKGGKTAPPVKAPYLSSEALSFARRPYIEFQTSTAHACASEALRRAPPTRSIVVVQHPGYKCTAVRGGGVTNRTAVRTALHVGFALLTHLRKPSVTPWPRHPAAIGAEACSAARTNFARAARPVGAGLAPIGGETVSVADQRVVT